MVIVCNMYYVLQCSMPWTEIYKSTSLVKYENVRITDSTLTELLDLENKMQWVPKPETAELLRAIRRAILELVVSWS